MTINKTDVVFGLSTLAGLTTLIMKVGGNLLTNTETLWFGLVSACLSFLAYAFYDYFEGNDTNLPPPTSAANVLTPALSSAAPVAQ